MNCLNECCELNIEPYKNDGFIYTQYKGIRKKAGVLIYNGDKVLLVQSRGNFWGFPKGTMENGEKVKDCALRELKEETGIELNKEDLEECVCIHNKALYYIYELKEEIGSVQINIPDNDVNGITWIKLKCLQDMFKCNQMKLNYHCKYLLQHHFGLKLNKY